MTTSAALQSLGLDAKTVAALRRKAKAEGQTTQAYLRNMIQAHVVSIDEILAPVREDFKGSAMTEEELDKMINAARRQYHQRKSTRKRR